MVHADPVHRARAALRSVPGGPERLQSGPPAHLAQGHADAIDPASRTDRFTTSPGATSTARAGACSNRGRRTSPRRCAPSARHRNTGGIGRTGNAASCAQRPCFRAGWRLATCRRVATSPVLPARRSATDRQSTPDLLVPSHTSRSGRIRRHSSVGLRRFCL